MITGSYDEGSFSSQAALLWSQQKVTEQETDQDEGEIQILRGKP